MIGDKTGGGEDGKQAASQMSVFTLQQSIADVIQLAATHTLFMRPCVSPCGTMAECYDLHSRSAARKSSLIISHTSRKTPLLGGCSETILIILW